MPPSPAVLETRLLGTILRNPGSAHLAVRTIGARWWLSAWTDPDRLAVAAAVAQLVETGQLPDPISVEARLGDSPATAILPNLLPHGEAPELVPQRARDLLAQALRRELRLLLAATNERLDGEPDLDPVGEALELTRNCAEIASASVREQPVADLVDGIVARYEAIRDGNAVTGLPLGHPALDATLMGVPYGKFVVLAARPSHGKTSYAGNIIDLALRIGHPVVFFSLDDDGELALTRLACIHAGISWRHAHNARLNHETEARYRETLAWLRVAPLEVYTNRSISPLQSRARLHALLCGRFRGSRPLVVVDFIQKQANAVEEAAQLDATSRVALASAQWKDTFEELDLPGLVLAQLNRSAAGSEPLLEHIKQCGGVEEDAYAVLLLWRPGRDDPRRPANQALVHLAKNKGGPTARCVFHFAGYCCRYTPWRDTDETVTEERLVAVESGTYADQIIPEDDI